MATWVYIPAEILPDAMEPCGKFWYATRHEAEAVMQSITNTRADQVLNVYHCYSCDGFHIGYTRAKKVAA